MRSIGYILGVVIGAPLLFFIISKVFLRPREVTEEQVVNYIENSESIQIKYVPWVGSLLSNDDERLGIDLIQKKLTFTNKGNSYIRAETYVYFCTELNKYVTTLVISEGGYVSRAVTDFGDKEKKDKYPDMYFYYNKLQYADPTMGTIDNPLPILHMVSAEPSKRSMRKDNKDSDTSYLQKVYHDNVQLYLSYFIEDKDYERLYPKK